MTAFRRLCESLFTAAPPARPPARPRLGVESLESREVMSGNVTVGVEAGDLVIRGDSRDNVVEVRQVSAGKFEVIGYGTTVNGSNSTKTFGGVTDDVRVDTGAGKDTVSIFAETVNKRLVVPDDLVIDTGSGDDVVALQCVYAKDDIEIETGSGKDKVGGLMVVAGDDVTVRKSSQNAGDFDEIYLAWLSAGAYGGNGTLTIDLNNGNDLVTLNSVEVDSLDVELSAGNDKLSMAYSMWDRGGTARIDGGSGQDTVHLYKNAVAQAPSVSADPARYGVETVRRDKVDQYQLF